MSCTIAVVNEVFEPLANVEVEAYDAAADEIVETQTTDKGGLATFADVTFPLESILFKPRNTRSMGPPKEEKPSGSDPNENTFGAASGTRSFGEINRDREEAARAAREGEGKGDEAPGGVGIMHIQLLGP